MEQYHTKPFPATIYVESWYFEGDTLHVELHGESGDPVLTLNATPAEVYTAATGQETIEWFEERANPHTFNGEPVQEYGSREPDEDDITPEMVDKYLQKVLTDPFNESTIFLQKIAASEARTSLYERIIGNLKLWGCEGRVIANMEAEAAKEREHRLNLCRPGTKA